MPSRNTLTTARLRLTPLDPERDAGQLHDAFTDPEVMRFWQWPVSADIGQTQQRLAESAGHSGALLWAVRPADDDEVLGLTGLLGEVAIPGLQWLLRRSAWGHGYATEAVNAVIDHAFTVLELDRVEAWADAENSRSLAVARKAGLTPRGRFSQRYPHRDRAHETVVLGRPRLPEPPAVLSVMAELPVRDVAATLRVLTSILDCRAGFVVGDPPFIAGVSLTPWNAGPGFHLSATEDEQVPAARLTVDTPSELDAMYRRAVKAGVDIAQRPTVQPWGRREFEFRLPEGHCVVISTPS